MFVSQSLPNNKENPIVVVYNVYLPVLTEMKSRNDARIAKIITSVRVFPMIT